MKRKLMMFLTLFFVGIGIATAQTRVTGVVEDENGAPVIGATIQVKGTGQGTVTDYDGKFSLSAPSDGTLVISYVGMEAVEVAVSPRIRVRLTTDAELLDEVVVTALGISRDKKALGYAVDKVGGDDLNKIQQTDAVSALSGRVSGVQISSSGNMGGSRRILIRGANSITQENQPLFVVDGIPMDNSNFSSTGTSSGGGGVDYGNLLNDLNPEDIEDMSVLKGPAAALYGSRAANGVILITTKKAKKGGLSSSAKNYSIEFNTGVDFSNVSTLPSLQRKYGGGATIRDSKGGVNGFQQIDYNGKKYLVPQYKVDESWGPKYDPTIQVVHWDGIKEDGIVETRPWVAPEHDVRDFWETGVTYNNSIAINRYGENFGIRFVYKNTNVKGAVPNSSQLKNDFKLSSDVSLTDKFKINATLDYVVAKSLGRPEIGYSDRSVGQKFFQWGQRQLDYERLKAYKNSLGEQRTWNRVSFSNPTPKYADNPYWTIYENYNDDKRNRLFGSVSASYEFIENLILKGSVYGDYYNFMIRERTAVGSQSTPYYYEATRENYEFNYEALLTYSKTFDKFGMNAMVGANKRTQRLDLLRGESSGGLVVPGLYTLKNSFDAPLLNDFTSEKLVNSVFGQVSFDYAGFLYLDATYRTDWSSTLPEGNNKYSYPSISGSILFSELFDIPWLSLGKLRLGFAQVGNDTEPYRVVPTYTYNTSGPFKANPRLFKSDEYFNVNLKSETTQSKEIGIDLNFLNGRIDFSATYFDNRTFDQIMPLQVSEATGYRTKFINAGEMSNKGIELSLNLVPVKTKDFRWDFGINYTKVNNKLEELYGDLKSLDIVRAPFGGVFLRASVNNTYGMLWGNDFLYDDNGNKVIGSNGYYMVNPNYTPIGSVLPDYTMGVSNSISFKGFNLGFLFDIRKGGVFYSLSHMWGMYSGMLEETAGVNDKGNEIRDPVSDGGGIKLEGVTGTVKWNEDGTKYTVSDAKPNEKYVSARGWAARVYHGYGMPSAQSVFKSDYIKLRELTLGYTLPDKWFKGAIRNARVSLFGKNLLTFGLDKKGFDPEMASNGSGNIQGLEGGLQPMYRTYGINLKFTY